MTESKQFLIIQSELMYFSSLRYFFLGTILFNQNNSK